jgi:hypothetical protein
LVHITKIIGPQSFYSREREREREEKTAQGANRWRHEKPMERGAKEHT